MFIFLFQIIFTFQCSLPAVPDIITRDSERLLLYVVSYTVSIILYVERFKTEELIISRKPAHLHKMRQKCVKPKTQKSRTADFPTGSGFISFKLTQTQFSYFRTCSTSMILNPKSVRY